MTWRKSCNVTEHHMKLYIYMTICTKNLHLCIKHCLYHHISSTSSRDGQSPTAVPFAMIQAVPPGSKA